MSSPSSGPPQARPEGDLIKVAQKRARLSARKAAVLAGISEGRWRQIVNGYQTVRKDMHVSVRGPDETVASMANAVGVTPDELAEAGREEAAEFLREMQARERKRNPPGGGAGGQAAASSDPRWAMLQASITAAGAGLTPAERAALREEIEKYLAVNPEWQPPSDDRSGIDQQGRQTG